MTSLFTQNDETTEILQTWWSELEHARGARATLRKAETPSQIVFCPSFHYLLNQLGHVGKPDTIAAIAGLIAHIKEDAHDAKLAAQMAAPKKSGGARISGLRFRRLLATTDRNDLYPLMIRVVRALDGKINLQDLAQSIYWWNESTRKQWAYDYYSAAPKEL